MGVFHNLLKEKKQLFQPLLDLLFWIICGVAFFFWSRHVVLKGNSLPISYSGLDALNEVAVYNARDLLVGYLTFVFFSYVVFFLFALCVYSAVHYVKWCLVLKRKISLKGLYAFALVSLVYAIPLFALFSFFFVKFKASGVVVFAMVYLPFMYFVTQLKINSVLFDSFKKSFKSLRVSLKGVVLVLGCVLAVVFLNFVFSIFTAQQATLLFVLVYLISAPFARHYFGVYHLEKIKKGKKRG